MALLEVFRAIFVYPQGVFFSFVMWKRTYATPWTLCFNGGMSVLYLDHNSTTPLHPEALEAMAPWLAQDYGNPSSTHRAGQKARAAMDGARERLAKVLNCKTAELIFTSGGTESINLALRGSPEARVRICTARTEHHATLRTCEALAAKGAELEFVEVDADGRLLGRPSGAGMVSFMHANNETGVIHPIATLAEAAHARGAVFHCDAIQSFGKLPVDLRALGVDLASFSAHKLGGPKGVGLLFKAEKARLAPQMTGGEQEGALRGGTENVAGIVGMAAAAEAACRDLTSAALAQETLRNLLQVELLKRIPGLKVVASAAPRISNTLLVVFPGGVESDQLIMRLDQEGVLVSAGSACAAGAVEPSHVLKAMGLPEAQARAVLRFSLGRGHSQADILRAAQAAEGAWRDFQKAGI
jgi:cysteine desulfurase